MSDQSLKGSQSLAKDPKYLQADSEVWSACADAQADLSLHWVHMQSGRKYCALAHIRHNVTKEITDIYHIQVDTQS